MRSPEARDAILAATARQIRERGYDHLTMEGIASAAGVSKQTIYRWWPARSSLVADCLLEGRLIPERLAPPRSADIRSDLVRWLGDIFSLADAPEGQGLLRSLIAAAAEDAAVGRRLHDSLAADASLLERLETARDAGQIPGDIPLEQIAESLIGAVILRALSRKPTGPAVIRDLVRVALGSDPHA